MPVAGLRVDSGEQRLQRARAHLFLGTGVPALASQTRLLREGLEAIEIRAEGRGVAGALESGGPVVCVDRGTSLDAAPAPHQQMAATEPDAGAIRPCQDPFPSRCCRMRPACCRGVALSVVDGAH